MDTFVFKVDAEDPDPNIIKKAAKVLQRGGLVAFPTETVYGLGADGLNASACKKIYEAKGRPSDNPLILHISDLSELKKIVKVIPPRADAVMEKFWPGPMTLIFQKADCVPKEVTGGLNTVAVRFPSHKVARRLIKEAGLPIAAPSANSSGKPSPTKASHVEYDLSGKIDMIIDGGSCEVGLESTILDLTGDIPTILRPGAVTKEMLEEVLGKVEFDPAILAKPDKNLVPKAPGMKYIHYSPKADVTLVRGNLKDVAEKINILAKEAVEKGIKVGIMATKQTADLYTAGEVLVVGDRDNIETIGEGLFRTLREFDHIGAEVVYSEIVEEKGEGAAIMNRLKKSAGYKFIDA